jgi:hypothetical protein
MPMQGLHMIAACALDCMDCSKKSTPKYVSSIKSNQFSTGSSKVKSDLLLMRCCFGSDQLQSWDYLRWPLHEKRSHRTLLQVLASSHVTVVTCLCFQAHWGMSFRSHQRWSGATKSGELNSDYCAQYRASAGLALAQEAANGDGNRW